MLRNRQQLILPQASWDPASCNCGEALTDWHRAVTSSRSTNEAQLPARLPCQIRPLLAWFGWLLAIKKRGLVGFWLASGWLVLTWLKLAGPPRCLGAALCRHCPSHKRSKVDGTCGLAKQPRRRSRLGRPEKGCTSLTPCKAALPNQASACLVWLASGWFLAETGWTSPLPGGGLVQALPLPQTKQSRWHNSTCGLAKQPRRRSRLGRPEKGCTSLTPCKAALPNRASASGWTSPCLEKYRTYLAETGVAGPPRCLGGLVEALPLPQTKQSRWHNSTHGLAKQTRCRSRLGRPEKGCTSLTPCKAQAASISPWTSRKRLHFLNSLQGCLAKSGLCLPGWTSPCLEKYRTYLAETGVAGPPRCLGAALWRHCPSHKRSK